jgi:short-subunit dehydrogenase
MISVLIFGGNSDIAISVADLLDPKTFKVTRIGRTDFDLAQTDISTDLDIILKQYKPDIIINCAGVLGDVDTKFDQIFNTNVRCNWEIIHYYLKNRPDKPLKFIMLGSSVYKQGRRNMILYAASKAALYNMWQGASEFCEDKNIVLGLINPVRVNTKMVKHLTHSNPAACLEAVDVSKEVVKLINTMEQSVSIDLDYKDIK